MLNSLRLCHAMHTEHISVVSVYAYIYSLWEWISFVSLLICFVAIERLKMNVHLSIWAFEMTCRIRISISPSPLTHKILNALTTKFEWGGNIWFWFGVNDIIQSIWNMYVTHSLSLSLSHFLTLSSQALVYIQPTPEKEHWSTHIGNTPNYYIRYMWKPLRAIVPLCLDLRHFIWMLFRVAHKCPCMLFLISSTCVCVSVCIWARVCVCVCAMCFVY